MSNRLKEYLEARDTKEPGWLPRYEKSFDDWDDNRGYLCGHYMGMLDELIAIIGERRVRTLVDTMIDIDIAAKQKATP